MVDSDIATPLLDGGIELKTVSMKVKSRIDAVMNEFRHWNYEASKDFVGHDGPVWSVAMTSDNLTAFSGSNDKKIFVWDVATQKKVDEIEYHTNTVSSLVVTHDDKYLISASWDNQIAIWD